MLEAIDGLADRQIDRARADPDLRGDSDNQFMIELSPHPQCMVRYYLSDKEGRLRERERAALTRNLFPYVLLLLVVCLRNGFTIPKRPMWPPGLHTLSVEED